ncbi:MAG: hypothetical protein DYH12_08005 [Sorangiineae bacterium PRO1]|nr:hypothetical protein [Sorangiineae bacterium PRO1]
MAFDAGQRVGGYLLVARLGAGGQGSVYPTTGAPVPRLDRAGEMTVLEERIAAATEDLRKRRERGESLQSALDEMKKERYTLPAIAEAILSVEGLSHLEVKKLLDSRGDWDDF